MEGRKLSKGSVRLDMSDKVAEGWRVLDEILLDYPGRENGEGMRLAKQRQRVTREEMKIILEKLFNITDELSIEVVWEHMLEVWAKADGEC